MVPPMVGRSRGPAIRSTRVGPLQFADVEDFEAAVDVEILLPPGFDDMDRNRFRLVGFAVACRHLDGPACVCIDSYLGRHAQFPLPLCRWSARPGRPARPSIITPRFSTPLRAAARAGS